MQIIEITTHHGVRQGRLQQHARVQASLSGRQEMCAIQSKAAAIPLFIRMLRFVHVSFIYAFAPLRPHPTDPHGTPELRAAAIKAMQGTTTSERCPGCKKVCVECKPGESHVNPPFGCTEHCSPAGYCGATEVRVAPSTPHTPRTLRRRKRKSTQQKGKKNMAQRARCRRRLQTSSYWDTHLHLHPPSSILHPSSFISKIIISPSKRGVAFVCADVAAVGMVAFVCADVAAVGMVAFVCTFRRILKRRVLLTAGRSSAVYVVYAAYAVYVVYGVYVVLYCSIDCRSMRCQARTTPLDSLNSGEV